MNNIEMLTDFMFEEMERLNDIDLEDPEAVERLEAEIKRAKSLGSVANTIVNAGRTQVEAMRYRSEYGGAPAVVPKLLGDS